MINSVSFVDVYMITYNHVNYIEKAILSVVNQKTNFKFRLIIGEDCSNDGTTTIVKELADRYSNIIIPLINSKNIGIIDNERQVYQNCTAKYLAYLEGDDYWIDNYKLQKQVDFLENNPEYGMVHTNLKVFNQRSNKFYDPIRISPIPTGFIFEDILKYPFIGTLTIMLRKSIIDEYLNEFKNEINSWTISDLPMKLYVAHHFKIGYIADITAIYRITKGSLSNPGIFSKKAEYLSQLNSIESFFVNRYGCGSETMKIVDDNINQRNFYKSFYTFDKDKIDEYYNLMKKKSLKDKLYLLGTKYSYFRAFFIKILKVSNFFGKIIF